MIYWNLIAREGKPRHIYLKGIQFFMNELNPIYDILFGEIYGKHFVDPSGIILIHKENGK